MTRWRVAWAGLLLAAIGFLGISWSPSSSPALAAPTPVPSPEHAPARPGPRPADGPGKAPARGHAVGVCASLQAVVVITPGWNSVGGRLQRWERPSLEGTWRPVGDAIPVVVGRKGMAWGHGLHEEGDIRGLSKQEGDGRAPAGCFALPEAFGFAPRSEARRFIHLPYRQLTPDTECVDDTRSREYNRITTATKGSPRDWSSSEKMRSVSVYRWGAWVGHNDGPITPGHGSCIFLHIWTGPTAGTAGCTAMPEPALKVLLGWLKPDARPVLVQLPREEHARRVGPWGLPPAP